MGMVEDDDGRVVIDCQTLLPGSTGWDGGYSVDGEGAGDVNEAFFAADVELLNSRMGERGVGRDRQIGEDLVAAEVVEVVEMGWWRGW